MVDPENRGNSVTPFFDANQQLFGNYKLTFKNIDDQLAEIENLELN